MTSMPAPSPGEAEVAAWAASGAMALTGRHGSDPLGPPAELVPRLRSIAKLLADRSRALGSRIEVDPLSLLAERAALNGLSRQGTTSCSSVTRLVPTRDGWFAVSLARPDDVELVPAWLELRGPPRDVWDAVTQISAASTVEWLAERAHLIGLPFGALPTQQPRFGSDVGRHPCLPARATRVDGIATPALLPDIRVVDLSSLWAGPLCGSLLAAGGADVIKVESVHRPDGARNGPPAFFELVNAGKRGVALDFGTHEGRTALASLISGADVVIEASRPRALEHLGIDARTLISSGGPAVWVSITGHGRAAAPNRVAFGDDAAVAGGLVCWEACGPCFCADAVADPATGFVATAAVLDALVLGGRWLVDVAMADVAEWLAGPTLPVPAGTPVAPPRGRTVQGRAPALGEHTAEVLATVTGETVRR